MMPPLEYLDMDVSKELVPLPQPVDTPSSQAVVYTDVNIVPEHDNKALERSISSLEAEISVLRSKERILDAKRREALDKILDIKGSIRVFARVRASALTTKREIESPVSINPEKITVSTGGGKKEFIFDNVFREEAKQEEVFQEVEPILRSTLDGHNVCIFAYGQTGTGKTFTMEGTNAQPGIVPRAIEELLNRVSREKMPSFNLSMSMLEVYMGNIRDLLANKPSSIRAMESIARSSLNILTRNNGSVEVEGLTNVAITDFKQASRWYAKGKRARATSRTNVNESSSRSHCLTRLTIERSKDVDEGSRTVSKLWMVDLGGSERLRNTGATGQTLDEGRAINLSLSALGDVIAALKRKHDHIPYRNSKLTQVLSDSLGDGSKVLMIVHISPREDDIGESLCSLNFAKRARAIETRELSEETKKQREKCIEELDKQIKDTEAELQDLKSQIAQIDKLVLEKKRHSAMSYQLEDNNGSPRSILAHQDIAESPQSTERAMSKAHHSSVPRYMASTVCSRERRDLIAELSASSKTLRSGYRSSVNFVGSQSISYSEPSLRSDLNTLKNKRMAYGNNLSKNSRDLSHLSKQESPGCNNRNLKSSLASASKKMSTSYPIFRITMHNKRRMSDLT